MRRAHDMPFGAEFRNGEVRFALWAPSAESVDLVLDGRDYPMPDVGDGWRRLTRDDARPGSRYGFRINGGQIVPDPASRYQPEDVLKPSAVVDPGAFAWSDGAWRGRPWEETVLYEAHVGTATEGGTFASLAERLEELRDLGITAVELLPISDFAGRRNWGYDGVLPFAPDSAYGSPDDLKRLVDRAHSLGLMVFLDVVYNHFGPAGNFLNAYAASFFTDRHKTPWGDGINFDGADGVPVREFFVHNAMYWIEEFHIDGLRFDAVHAILDDREPNILAEIANRTRAAVPDREVHLVLENEENAARWLGQDDCDRSPLYTSQWNDDIHHCWHTLLTGESESYYGDFADDSVGRLGRSLAEGFVYQGEVSSNLGHARGEPSGHLPPSAFVAFLQNHDQIGNRAVGERLHDLASPEKVSLARAGLLLAPQIPMLFMGEEWAASTPFQFFVDFEPDAALSKAVREGRQREFQTFAAFAGDGASSVPDPTAESTFKRSILNWSERDAPAHAAVLAETRELMHLRAAEIVPLTKTHFHGATSHRDGDVLDVVWRFDGGTLRFVANFGDSPATTLTGAIGNVVWQTPGLDVSPDAQVDLKPWTGFFVKGVSVDER